MKSWVKEGRGSETNRSQNLGGPDAPLQRNPSTGKYIYLTALCSKHTFSWCPYVLQVLFSPLLLVLLTYSLYSAHFVNLRKYAWVREKQMDYKDYKNLSLCQGAFQSEPFVQRAVFFCGCRAMGENPLWKK